MAKRKKKLSVDVEQAEPVELTAQDLEVLEEKEVTIASLIGVPEIEPILEDELETEPVAEVKAQPVTVSDKKVPGKFRKFQ